MSQIPNVRSKYKETPYTSSTDKKELNPYWEQYLGDSEKNYVAGYDLCAEEAVGNFFSNIANFKEDLQDAGLNVNDIEDEILYADENVPEDKLKKASPATRILYAIREALQISLEMDRDEMVTSLFDNMSDEEYQANVAHYKETEER